MKPVVVAMMAGSLVANAHPGHSLSGTSARHIVTSPYHLAVLTLAGLALFGAARLVKREFPRQLLQLSGATLMLMAVLVWGLRS
ncbi:MAG TPA: hypothetical protein VHH73_02310 [Verrucomicrobiae bacterium]|nr:hypothetical protein [Verrucomicrobiae bacterium]